MTTGSRGLHVLVTLDRSWDVDQVRDFAHRTAEVLASRRPEELTTAAPYAVHALPGAPVAAPISLGQVEDPDLTAQRWTMADAEQLRKEHS